MRRASASAQLLRTLYCALIRSVISNAFPAWRNVASTRLMSFVKLEIRICRIFDITPRLSLQNFLHGQCDNLAKAALHPQHPLHVIFDCAATRYSSRLGANHRRQFARTARFEKHFIKFAWLYPCFNIFLVCSDCNLNIITAIVIILITLIVLRAQFQ